MCVFFIRCSDKASADQQELERQVADIKGKLARNKARQDRIASLLAGGSEEPVSTADALQAQFAAVAQLKVCLLSNQDNTQKIS